MIGKRGGIACVVVAIATFAAPPLADAAPARRNAPPKPVADTAAPLGRVLAETAEVRSGAGFSYRVMKTPIVPGSKADPKNTTILESMPVRSVITFPAHGTRLAAGARKKIGPLKAQRFAGSDGLVAWTYSSATSVTVGAFYL